MEYHSPEVRRLTISMKCLEIAKEYAYKVTKEQQIWMGWDGMGCDMHLEQNSPADKH